MSDSWVDGNAVRVEWAKFSKNDRKEIAQINNSYKQVILNTIFECKTFLPHWVPLVSYKIKKLRLHVTQGHQNWTTDAIICVY